MRAAQRASAPVVGIRWSGEEVMRVWMRETGTYQWEDRSPQSVHLWSPCQGHSQEGVGRLSTSCSGYRNRVLAMAGATSFSGVRIVRQEVRTQSGLGVDQWPCARGYGTGSRVRPRVSASRLCERKPPGASDTPREPSQGTGTPANSLSTKSSLCREQLNCPKGQARVSRVCSGS